ncbi:phosphate/phosphite/phosphonate ABC transporter substrate-binding protein [Pontivivens insulae]|uniref:Phosphate-import protein PhnD n=1 Tax=Pontivivens insulae TaxID=1639689 RepID=A0A2R8AD41_9RHOB|nr:PhnD/SsuA/transferrin family substrate-binding protein [Pontivivens insulae]RED14090.1 phosphonate ABC transporter substrate-binding protein [Pontivivens insulae]SPF30164.1 hypothetical protein POI8812_02498 [Pontivivens insulae]
MRASLPMYDFPEFRAETDAFWAAVRAAHGPDAPELLERDNPWIWDAEDLFLSQTCGWPWINGLAGSSQIVARPVLTCEGGGIGTYRSAMIVRTEQAEQPSNARFVANSAGSLSGWIGPRRWMSGQNMDVRDAPDLLSGGHRESVQMVRDGKADMAGIDAVSWHMIQQVDPVDGLSVIGWSDEAPALPYIASPNLSPGQIANLQTALRTAIAAPEVAGYRAATSIEDMVDATAEDYAVLHSW